MNHNYARRKICLEWPDIKCPFIVIERRRAMKSTEIVRKYKIAQKQHWSGSCVSDAHVHAFLRVNLECRLFQFVPIIVEKIGVIIIAPMVLLTLETAK